MNWEVCCQPRECGGLGIRILQEKSKLFLMKFGYKLVTNTNKMWVQVLRNKYKVNGILPDNIHQSNYSIFDLLYPTYGMR